MKKSIVYLLAAFFAVFLLWQAEPTKAVSSPITSIEWANPAMGGWAFGDATRTVTFTVADASLYDEPTTTDNPPTALPTVAWYYGDNGIHVAADSITRDGNAYTATFNLTGTTEKRAGALGIVLTDVTTHQPIVPDAYSQYNMTDMSLFMAHNINIKDPSISNPEHPCYSATRTDQTTDLTQVTDFRAVDLTVMCPAMGKIHFTSPLAFTTTTQMQALRSIFESLDAARGGTFGLNDDTLEMLRNAGAEVTMFNLPYVSAPDVKYNGAGGGQATNVSFNAADRSVTFSANHFSTYTAIPKVTLTAPSANSSTVSAAKYTVTGTVSDPAATVKIYVGNLDQGTVTVNSDGTFSKEITLIAGENNIKVTSSNSIASGYDVTKTIIYTALPATGLSVNYALALIACFGLGIVMLTWKKRSA